MTTETVDLTLPKGDYDGERHKKRRFRRNSSSMTGTTVPDGEAEEVSAQLTIPEDASSAPGITEILELTVQSGDGSHNRDTSPPEIETTTKDSEDISTLPAFTNSIPPPVVIDGYPSLRVVFRRTCLFRRRAQVPTHEWQSHYFFQRIGDETTQAECGKCLERDGFIRIPDSLFGNITVTDEDAVLQILAEFFERFALPNQHFPTFSEFTNPTSRFLEGRRILWWKTLADHLYMPHYLDRVFFTGPENWHIVYHALPTFAAMREFSEATESLGFRRAKERIHQELARRIAWVKGHSKIRPKTRFALLKKGYAELRDLSKAYDRVEKDGVAGIPDCVMCNIQPPLMGSTA